MSKSLTLSFLLLLLVNLGIQADPIVEKLTTINSQWKNRVLDIQYLPKNIETAKFRDEQWIQLHLTLVLKTLRNQPNSQLSIQLQENRAKNLTHLAEYIQLNKYPINNKVSYRNPVFIDDYNTFCAVGYLIKTSGNENLARLIASENNLSYLKDIKTKGLQEWVQNSGFTLDELAWIQPGYQSGNNSRALSNGVNGKVNAIIKGDSLMNIYVGGKFDLADSSIACKNVIEIHIGHNEYTFKAIGNSLEGEVFSLYNDQEGLYAGGKFTDLNNGSVSNIAKWNGTEWLPIGKLDGTVYTITKYKNQLYAGGEFFFEKNGQKYQHLAKFNGNEWEPVSYYLNGIVHAMTIYENKLIIGGAFKNVDSFEVNYIFSYDGVNIGKLDSGVNAPVKCLQVTSFFSIQDSVILAAGDLNISPLNNIFGIAEFGGRIFKDKWNFTYRNSGYGTIKSIKSMSGKYLGGDLTGGMMYWTSGTGIYNPINWRIEGFASLGLTNAILQLGETVVIGGEFKSLWQGENTRINANNLAIWSSKFTGLNTEFSESKKTIQVFPNPLHSELTIRSTNDIHSIQLYTVQGKLIFTQADYKQTNQVSISKSELPDPGIYILNIEESDGQVSTQKVIVE